MKEPYPRILHLRLGASCSIFTSITQQCNWNIKTAPCSDIGSKADLHLLKKTIFPPFPLYISISLRQSGIVDRNPDIYFIGKTDSRFGPTKSTGLKTKEQLKILEFASFWPKLHRVQASISAPKQIQIDEVKTFQSRPFP